MPSVKFKDADGNWQSVPIEEDWSAERIAEAVDSFGKPSIKDQFAQVSDDFKKQQMTHLTSSEGPNYTQEYERAKAVPTSETILPFIGSEMSNRGSQIRMLWNKATGDQDEYDKILANYRNEKELIKPLDVSHPFSSIISRSVPYVAPSSTLAKAVGTVPYNAFMKTIPPSMRVTPVLPQMPKGVEAFLNGQGPMSSVVNPLKVANATLERVTKHPTPESITSGIMNILNKPGVQAAGLGGALAGLDPDDKAWKGALSGLAASGLIRTLAAPISKSPKYLTTSQKQAVQAADDLGIYLDPGTRTGDPFKEKLAKMLKDDPIASPIAANIDNARSAHINRLIGKHFGIVDDTPELNATVLANIQDRLRARLDKYTNMSDPYLTRPMVRKLDKIRKEQVMWEGGHERGAIVDAIDRIKYIAGVTGKSKWGRMTPQQYTDLRTLIRQLKDKEFEAKGGTPQEGKAFNSIMSVIDDMLVQGVPQKIRKQVASVIKDTRRQYAEFATLQQATDKTSGKVSLTKLYDTMLGSPSAKNTNYKFLREENLFTKLARVGRLESETKGKMDLSTRNTIGSFLHEGRPVYNKLAKGAVMGWTGLPSNVIKRGVANFYFNPSGWPSATGFLPILGKESGDRMNKILTRSMLAPQPALEDLKFWE